MQPPPKASPLRKPKSFKYRKVRENSRVDESLFGTIFRKHFVITGRDTVTALWSKTKQISCGAATDPVILREDDLAKVKVREHLLSGKTGTGSSCDP